jgi:hypothetical protein
MAAYFIKVLCSSTWKNKDFLLLWTLANTHVYPSEHAAFRVYFTDPAPQWVRPEAIQIEVISGVEEIERGSV